MHKVMAWLHNSMELEVYNSVSYLNFASDIWNTFKIYSYAKSVSSIYELYQNLFSCQ